MDLVGIDDDIYDSNYRFNTANKQPLRSTRKLFQVWPQSPSEDQLHIYVTLPANMGSPILVDAVGKYSMRLFVPSEYLTNIVVVIYVFPSSSFHSYGSA